MSVDTTFWLNHSKEAYGEVEQDMSNISQINRYYYAMFSAISGKEPDAVSYYQTTSETVKKALESLPRAEQIQSERFIDNITRLNEQQD